ncbi:MAG TPA: sialidase family protein [Candidatus Nitrosotalea sp.]|nr:sialidase family protein [Candidatus Nitrosotalea sp.]
MKPLLRSIIAFTTSLSLARLVAAATAADSAEVPGVVIDHAPAASKQYVGSPGIAILPSGQFIASHDFFGPGTSNDRTAVFASEDRGRTWTRIADIQGQWWSSLFVHNGALYLMGTSGQDGYAVIRRSTDGGRTWTTPRNGTSGLLLNDGRYHCAPVPVVVHNKRIWRAMEDVTNPGGRGTHFKAFVMSAPVDADLLNAGSWTCSNRVGADPDWLDDKFGGWLEGNVVVSPTGRILDILRVDFRAGPEKAAIIDVSDDGTHATFDAKTGFVEFPGGCKKFTIRFDPRSRQYWSLANFVPARHRNGNPERTRNTLALTSSSDLRTWTVRTVVLHHSDTERHGFQYADWQFDGDDIVAVVRTAYDDGVGGAHSQHDANYLTFHRIRNFRDLTMVDSPPELRDER